MKMPLIFFVLLFFISNANAQVRFTEIDVNNGNNFIELFASSNPDVDLGHYNVVVYNGTNWYNIDIPNNGTYRVGAKKGMYFTIAQPVDIRYTSNKNTIKKADFVYANGGNDFLVKNKSNYVFLLKNGIVIDVIVTQSNQLQAAQAISALPYPTPISITDDGASYDVKFSLVSVTSYAFANMSSGSGSYSLTTSVNCGSVWEANNSNYSTPGFINHGVTADPVFYYFSSRMQYIQQSTWTDLNEGSGLPYQNGSLISSSPWVERFRYVISNFPIEFLPASTNPEFEIWADGNGDNLLDESGTSDVMLVKTSDYSVNTSPTINAGEYAFSFDITNSTKVHKADNSMRTLFFKFKAINNTGSCFINQNRMLMQSANLPVVLKNFYAKRFAGFIQLGWSTSSENNNLGFEVQRSSLPSDDFKSIGFVGTNAKSGFSQAPIQYFFEDRYVEGNLDFAYRLKQIDSDGKFMLSEIKYIKVANPDIDFRIYPNPSHGTVKISNLLSARKLRVTVYDLHGRAVLDRFIGPSSNIELHNMDKGIYTMRLDDQSASLGCMRRVVVQ